MSQSEIWVGYNPKRQGVEIKWLGVTLFLGDSILVNTEVGPVLDKIRDARISAPQDGGTLAHLDDAPTLFVEILKESLKDSI